MRFLFRIDLSLHAGAGIFFRILIFGTKHSVRLQIGPLHSETCAPFAIDRLLGARVFFPNCYVQLCRKVILVSFTVDTARRPHCCAVCLMDFSRCPRCNCYAPHRSPLAAGDNGTEPNSRQFDLLLSSVIGCSLILLICILLSH